MPRNILLRVAARGILGCQVWAAETGGQPTAPTVPQAHAELYKKVEQHLAEFEQRLSQRAED